jgi:hypothetical protein
MYVGTTLKKVSKVEMEIIKIELIKVYFDER